MKTEIFKRAIITRNKLKFIYDLSEVTLEPYYISRERNGKKVIYGKVYNSSEIKKFNYNRIANIRVLGNKRFSPIIPIIHMAS